MVRSLPYLPGRATTTRPSMPCPGLHGMCPACLPFFTRRSTVLCPKGPSSGPTSCRKGPSDPPHFLVCADDFMFSRNRTALESRSDQFSENQTFFTVKAVKLDSLLQGQEDWILYCMDSKTGFSTV